MNRYFTTDDPTANNIAGHNIPDDWWSRIYEYPWAATQIVPGEIVVDAGCGLIHPFKDILAEHCSVYAVDAEQGVLDLPPNPKIAYLWNNICQMDISDQSVDAVFCISVLEHMTVYDRGLALKEMYRILRPGGRLILTFDVDKDDSRGWIDDPQDIYTTAVAAGFHTDEKDLTVFLPPPKAVEGLWGLRVFRLVMYK